MARLHYQTRVIGRLTLPINQGVYDLSATLEVSEENASRVSAADQKDDFNNNEREPKGIYLRHMKGTTGLPKGRKVLGDGVAIVPTNFNLTRGIHTTAVT